MAASHSLSRRELLWLLALSGCGSAVPTPKPFTLPDQTPTTFVDPPPRYSDSVDALFDVLLPAERDARGNVTVPGAREANADAVMRLESVVRLAIAQGFIAPMNENLLAAVDDLAGSARAALNRDLDLLASFEHPLLPFWKLPLEAQNAIVSRAFDDPTRRPVMLVMRAVCFLAYLGGGPSDVGLQALGYPAFENVEAGLAVSGYPRTLDGRLVNAETEDLRALAAAGQLDDYTYNQAPPPTNGDDLSLALTPEGDLL